MHRILLGIESSCDDSAAAVLVDGQIRANVVSSQLKHAQYGGVVPELASRLHQVGVPAVAQQALAQAGIRWTDLTAIAFTAGPGLMGSLIVGTSYAKGLALALGIPLVPVNHLQGHIASLYVPTEGRALPEGPLVCLTVSGGHTQIQIVHSPLAYETLGRTMDDAAGEAFDKAAKLLGLPYPGGPLLDKLAQDGNPAFHVFPNPAKEGWSFSFSGLKTSFLYFLQKQQAQNPQFLEQHRADLAASIQHTIVEALIQQLFGAAKAHGIQQVGIVGGVSANSLLRRRFAEECDRRGLQGHIPPFEYCTDNAAMIAVAGDWLYRAGHQTDAYVAPYPTGTHL